MLIKDYKREYKVNYDRHELYSYIMSGVEPKIIYEKMGITYKQYKLGEKYIFEHIDEFKTPSK